MLILISMLLLGSLIGFVGAGGAGVVITLLTVGFGIPIHTALATALASMVFTMLSGTISHFHEHEVVVGTAVPLGLGGIFGAFVGANFSDIMPSNFLGLMTGIMICSSAVILYVKLYHGDWLKKHVYVRETLLTGKKLWLYGIICGLICGFLSGAFGIGSAAYIQLALMMIFGLPLLQSIGTCMAIILPISAAGGLGYLLNGHLDPILFIETLVGLMIGAFIGAKFTHRAPLPFLRLCIVSMPAIGGILMLLFH